MLYTTRFRLMGGGASVKFVDNRGREQAERVARAVEAEARRIEVKFSRYRENSVISEINRNAGRTPVAVDRETEQLLLFALDLARITGGRFDPTVGVLRRAWDFRAGTVPSAADVGALLPLVDASAVAVEDGTVFLRGQVASREQVEHAVEVAGKIPGVARVENLLHLPGTDAPHPHAGTCM